MGWMRDFVYSSFSDALLPIARPMLEDVVFEILGERQVPTRTDFREIRDLVNGMRGPVSSAATTARRLEERMAALEQSVEDLGAQVRAVQAPKKAPARKKAASKKKAPARKKKAG